MTWKRSIATTEISSGTMRHRGGDRDVHTKDGRRTRVVLRAEDIRLDDDGKSFRVDLYYEVYERHKDYTKFSWEDTVRLAIPSDARGNVAYAVDVREYNRTWDVYGKNHKLMSVPLTENACIAEGSMYQIDGGGNDQNNAHVELIIKVPFIYYDTA